MINFFGYFSSEFIEFVVVGRKVYNFMRERFEGLADREYEHAVWGLMKDVGVVAPDLRGHLRVESVREDLKQD